MGIIEILAIWFGLSLTGALAPGPLSAAVVMQSSKHGRLYGILPMVGHAIVELGIVAAIIVSVQIFSFDQLATSLMIGFGGIVIVFFGGLALKDYRFKTSSEEKENSAESKSLSSAAEATTQGALVSILSPYFLLWWAAIGLSNVTLLIGELQVGVGTVFLAGVLIYLVHISTDFLFGAFLTVGTDAAKKRTTYGGVNWINVGIGIFQIILGIYFVFVALT
ncbi:MAG: LysE family transporter [Candidatus Thorarchaeota archaeon]|nr:LysE family transporter [Candidatus Thorarchaeota archaeon]